MPKQAVINGIEQALETAGFDIEEVTLEEASRVTEKEYIRNTHTVDL